MVAIEIIAVIIGGIYVINLIATAFGGLNAGKARRILNRVATLGTYTFLIYLAVMVIYGTFSGLSVSRSIRSVFGNIFAVVLAISLAAILLMDFFQKKDAS